MGIQFGCAGTQHVHGDAHADLTEDTEGTTSSAATDGELESAEESEGDEAEQIAGDKAVPEGSSADTQEPIGPIPLNVQGEAPELQVARASQHRIPSADNHLGLVLAVGERTSDLPWVMSIDNRSEHDVTLAALPSLIRLEIAPEASKSDEEIEPATKPVICQGKLPKTLGSGDTKVLPTGAMMVHAFDPRSLCEDESVLASGSVVRLTFGFPKDVKKLWQKGKLTEVETEQKAPFLAERVETGTEKVEAIKHLNAQPFTLGRTYPLSEVKVRPEQQPGEMAKAGSETDVEAIPEPLEVKIFPLGTSENPEKGLVRAQVRNVSKKSVTVHLRREAFSYEVAGPMGTTTCRMLPDQLAATTLSYSTIAPGSSMTLSTRLAEACPAGVWDRPGTYTVAVRFSPSSSGEEERKGAFVGTIAGKNVATLTVPGTRESQLPQMLIVR